MPDSGMPDTDRCEWGTTLGCNVRTNEHCDSTQQCVPQPADDDFGVCEDAVSTGGLGDACAVVVGCSRDFICVRPPGAVGRGVCQTPCSIPASCSCPGGFCLPSGDLTEFGGCFQMCSDPITGLGCGGMICSLTHDFMTPVCIARSPFAGERDAECFNSTECGVGLACGRVGTSSGPMRCLHVCELPTGACEGGGTCVPAVGAEDERYGLCSI